MYMPDHEVNTKYLDWAKSIAQSLVFFDKTGATWIAVPARDGDNEISLCSSDSLVITLRPQEKGRVKFGVHLGPLYNDFHEYRDEIPSIGVSGDRDASDIAKDISRRMLPELREYRATLIKRQQAQQERIGLVNAAFEKMQQACPYLESHDGFTSRPKDEKGFYLNVKGAYLTGHVSISDGRPRIHIERVDLPYPVLLDLLCSLGHYIPDTPQE